MMNDLALIIGAGIGGLTTGALLAKRGWKVIVLEQSSRIGGCCGTFSRSGFRFDVGPTFFPNILWGGLDSVFRELGLDLERIFQDTFYQVCIPGHRISLYRNPDAMMEEWAREFPEALKSINKSSGRALSRSLKKSPALPVFDLQTLFWGQTEFTKTAIPFASQVAGLPSTGGFCLKGGGGSISNPLFEYIGSHRGEVRLGCRVKEILTEKNDAVGIRLESGEVMEGRCYIANTTPWGIYERLISDGHRMRRMIHRMRKTPTPNSVFALFLGVKESCIPSRMCHEVLYIPSPTKGENDSATPLFIAMNPPEDMGRAPEGYRAMSIFKYEPYEHANKGKEYFACKKRIEEEIIHGLKGLMPFIDEGISLCESATPATYERFTGRPLGRIKGVPQTLSVLHNKAFSEFTCYRNLFLTGDCVPLCLGVEGVCLSALRLTDWICKRYS
ncbi:NAD(P)/FAD-dependent oxidoreductase [bacterium]|nr:NAD(P)/FAD-dependent oxidoreductase [bacterium]